MIKRAKHISPSNPEDIRTIVGEGTQFKGALSFEGSARIDGKVEGEITSEGTLFVGEHSVIKADIKVNSITVSGKVCGNITASCRLVVLSGAEINGNIQAPSLQIEEGATFEGTCEMRPDVKGAKLIAHSKSDNGKELPDNNKTLKEAA